MTDTYNRLWELCSCLESSVENSIKDDTYKLITTDLLYAYMLAPIGVY